MATQTAIKILRGEMEKRKLLTDTHANYIYSRVKDVVDPQVQHLKRRITERGRSQHYSGL